MADTSGLYIGLTAPEDTTLIWFDTTPSQKCHKVYDFFLLNWIVLKQEIISVIQYSELVNLASGDGLSLGAHYRITDKLNAIAVAITTTKVQYTDALGNIVIDDLGENIQYHVTSSNLLIDNLAGVFDLTNKKLVFTFSDNDFDYNDGYLFGKSKIAGAFALAKYKLSKFISIVEGNSLSWNNGLYMNFKSVLDSWKDKTGGVVSQETYVEDMSLVSRNIDAIGSSYQGILDATREAITNAASPTNIFSKSSPALTLTGEALDVAVNDSLLTIISKIQRWINKFKVATGIVVSDNFSPSVAASPINNNDTVNSALQKTQSQINYISGVIKNKLITYFVLLGDSVPTSNNWLPQGMKVGDSVEIYGVSNSSNERVTKDVMIIWDSPASCLSGANPIIQVIFKVNYAPRIVRIKKISEYALSCEFLLSGANTIYRTIKHIGVGVVKLNAIASTLSVDSFPESNDGSKAICEIDMFSVQGIGKIVQGVTVNDYEIKLLASRPVTSSLFINFTCLYNKQSDTSSAVISTPVDIIISILAGESESAGYTLSNAVSQPSNLSLNTVTPNQDINFNYTLIS